MIRTAFSSTPFVYPHKARHRQVCFVVIVYFSLFHPFWLQHRLERMERSNISDELLTYWGGSLLQLSATASICMCISTSSSGCSFKSITWFCLAQQPLPALSLMLAGRAHQGTSQAWQDKDVPASSACAQPDHTTAGAGGRDGMETQDKGREMVGGWAGQGSPGKDELNLLHK